MKNRHIFFLIGFVVPNILYTRLPAVLPFKLVTKLCKL